MQTEPIGENEWKILDRLSRIVENEEPAEFEFLEKCSRHADMFVRLDTATALCFNYTLQAENILLRLAEDSEWLVRTEACDSLGGRESATVLSAVEGKIRRDRSALVRSYAIHAYGDAATLLHRERGEVVAFLEGRLPREKSHWTRLALYKVLYLFGRTDYLDDLLKGLELSAHKMRCTAGNNLKEVVNADNCRKIRAAALDSLGRESTPAMVEIVVKLIDLTISAELEERQKKDLILQ